MGNALRAWLPQLIPGIDVFHSEEIAKGRNWHAEVIRALRDCSIGIFCIAPESLRSQWMLFEAGALAQHGDQPALYTYTLSPIELTGPFGHFQATRFEREDTRRFIRELARSAGTDTDEQVLERFDSTWESFRSEVDRTARVSLEELIPGFFALFDGRKTFEEPFPECTNRRWDDRLRRTVRTHELLSRPESSRLLAGASAVADAYEALIRGLDRYDMHIGALLLRPVSFQDLSPEDQARLEQARQRVVDAVLELRRLTGEP
jgi:hypothetical protein